MAKRKHPHGWSSSSNQWRDPKSLNSNKGCAVAALAMASAPLAFAVMTGGYFAGWWG